MRLGRSSYRKESAEAWLSTTAGQRHVVGGAHEDVIRRRGLHPRVEGLLEHLAAAYTKLNLTHIGS